MLKECAIVNKKVQLASCTAYGIETCACEVNETKVGERVSSDGRMRGGLAVQFARHLLEL